MAATRMDNEAFGKEIARLKAMVLPANRAKGFTRLLWRERNLSPRLLQAIAPDTCGREWVITIFNRLQSQFNHKARWWREKNLETEIAKAVEGEPCFILDLAKWISEAKKQSSHQPAAPPIPSSPPEPKVRTAEEIKKSILDRMERAGIDVSEFR